MKSATVNIKQIPSMEFRFDPSLHLSEGVKVRKVLEELPYEIRSLSSVTDRIFLGNIFSRIWVKDREHGIPYLAASDTVLANLDTGQFLAKKQAIEMPYLFLKKGWILVTCSGTLGNTSYTNGHYEGRIATHDLIRIVPDEEILPGGYVYAFLSSKYGYYQITQSQFGGVVKHINATQAGQIKIPLIPKEIVSKADTMIEESARLREEAQTILRQADKELKSRAGLRDLNTEDYNYYGAHPSNRKVSVFSVRRSSKDVITIHAFNHSERMKNTLSMLDNIPTISLGEAISDDGWISPGGVKVLDLSEGNGIMLINQSDIFDNIIKGKWVPRKDKYEKDLLCYGDILIAKIGTLGENETFCRCIFANEDLDGQLISSAFYKLKPSGIVPSGYLYCWLSSDWGFRQLRSSQYGTKQCYPNPKLLNEYRMPILSQEEMEKIDKFVRKAYTYRYKANEIELKAIAMVESEIEKWSKK